MFYNFNKDTNKISNSKIKHFAFNNNAKKVHYKLLHLKNLEANMLNILITKEKQNIISSKKRVNAKNTILSSKKDECIDFKKNGHIKPSILNVSNNIEYLPKYYEYNKFGNILNIKKQLS